MRNRFVTLVLAAGIVLTLPSLAAAQNAPRQAAPAASAKAPFDSHDLNGIWSRNNQGWGGGGTCAECGDRGFGNNVPPMTPEGESSSIPTSHLTDASWEARRPLATRRNISDGVVRFLRRREPTL